MLLAEFKDHLRIDGSDEDAALGAQITAARTIVEAYLDAVLIARTLDVTLDAWSLVGAETAWWNGTQEGVMPTLDAATTNLPVRPVLAVEEIHIKTVHGGEVLWGADNYSLQPGLNPRLLLTPGRRWPVPGVRAGGIRLRLTCGFGASWNDVPASLRQAVLLLAAFLYANRGDMAAGEGGALQASGAGALLKPFRKKRL